MLYGWYIHQEDHVQYDLSDFDVYSRKIINMFIIGQVSVLVKNFNIGIDFL